MPGGPFRRPADGGAAVAEFVLVSTLLLLLFLGIVQVGLVLHARNVLAADAAEGARHGARLGVAPAAGGRYAQDLVRGSVPGIGAATRCTGVAEAGADGVPLTRVTCRGRLRLVVLPLGGTVDLTVTAHALREVAAP